MGVVKLCLLFLVLLTFTAPQASAQTPMESGSYKIDQGQVDILDTQNQTATPKAYSMQTKGSYSFSISENIIDFGLISPTNPLIRKNTVQVNSNTKYFLKAYENHQLISTQGEVIPDTLCDSGHCSEQVSDNWKSVVAYGFGFRCDSPTNICGQEYSGPDSFSQLANKARNESLNSLLSNTIGRNQIDLTFKLNISSFQKPGNYTNNVTLLLLPSY